MILSFLYNWQAYRDAFHQINGLFNALLFLPPEKGIHSSLGRTLGKPQSRPWRFGEEKYLMPLQGMNHDFSVVQRLASSLCQLHCADAINLSVNTKQFDWWQPDVLKFNIKMTKSLRLTHQVLLVRGYMFRSLVTIIRPFCESILKMLDYILRSQVCLQFVPLYISVI